MSWTRVYRGRKCCAKRRCVVVFSIEAQCYRLLERACAGGLCVCYGHQVRTAEQCPAAKDEEAAFWLFQGGRLVSLK